MSRPTNQQDGEEVELEERRNGTPTSDDAEAASNGNRHFPHRRVRLKSSAASKKTGADVEAKRQASKPSKLRECLTGLDRTPPDWVLTHAKRWKSWKIVIRCSIAAWVGLLLMLVRPTERAIGQAAFLMNIVSIIMPPADPIAPTIERYIVSAFIVAFAWAFACIGIRCSWLARSKYQYASSETVAAVLAQEGIPTARLATEVQRRIFRGDYVETGSSVVLAFWYFMYCGLILYFRAWMGPSPYVPGVILSIIMATIVLLYSPLFPYPFYALGKQFFIPFIVQIAINLVCTALVFPESVHNQFLDRLTLVIQPLHRILKDQPEMLGTDPESDEWTTFAKHRATHAGATKALGLLGATEELLARNVSVQRASGEDLQQLLNSARALNNRTGGFIHFQDFVETHLRTREDDDEEGNLVFHFAPSRAGSPRGSRPVTPHSSRPLSASGSANRPPTGLRRTRSHGLLHDLLHPHRSQKESQQVGFIESSAYMMLEERLGRGQDLGHLPDLMLSLKESCSNLLSKTDAALTRITEDLANLKSSTLYGSILSKSSKMRDDGNVTEASVITLTAAIKKFEQNDRLQLVHEFAHLFDPEVQENVETGSFCKQSHRGLFLGYTYQFALLSFAQAVLEMLEELARIQKKSVKLRLNIPPLKKLGAYLFSDSGEGALDEDPETINGLDTDMTRERDPDVLRATNLRHRFGAVVWKAGHRLAKPDVLFGLKAGVFSCLAAFPAFFSSTAGFYYSNRGIWVFVGDTAFQFISRVMGTFVGAVVGLVIWYIGNAGSQGNPYGMGAVCAVAFPLMLFYRLYHPIIVQGIVTMVTAVLVIGYSWQNATFPSGGDVGWGWQVAWRRFLLVLIGISVAFVAAYIPPRSTQKKAIRLLYARTLDANARMLFRLISMALQKKGPQALPPNFNRDVTSLRAKLLRSASARAMIRYEVSLRGKWPAKQYEKLAALQIDMVDLIAQLGTVILSLPDAWTRAILKRTRLLDPDFLAHISSTTSLASNSLRVGRPLPFYHAPLLQSFLRQSHGYEISIRGIHDPELPSHVDLYTLSLLEYLKFSTAISHAYSIINRLDRMMMVVKQLVGEDLQVYGVGIDGTTESEEALLQDAEESRQRL